MTITRSYRTDPADILRKVDELERRVRRRENFVAQDPEYKPGAPDNVALTFRVREKKTQLTFRGIVKWDPLAPGVCLADIDEWVIHLRATNAAGTPIEAEPEDADDILRKKVIDAREFDDTGTDFPHAVFPNLPRPKKWYWQARVRIIDKHRRKGTWSAWTAPQLPVQEALPKPPTPTGLALAFDRKEKRRHDPFRAVLTWDEVGTWDIPGFDEQDDVDRYVIALRTCDAAGNFAADDKARRKTIKSEKHEEDPNDTVRAIFPGIRKRQWYRARVKTVDRFNRPGDWSAWTPAGRAIDGINPPDPTAVTLTVRQRAFIIEWEQPLDPNDPDGQEIDEDIAYSIVELASDASYTTIVKKDRYVGGTKKKFKASKPGNGTYYARVQNVDGAGNKSNWVSTSDSRKTPPGPSIGGFSFDTIEKGREGVLGGEVVVAAPITGYDDDDIDRYIVQVQVSKNGSTWGNAPKLFRIEADTTPLSARFRIKKKRWVRARARCVDTDGKRSPWTGWTAATQAEDNVLPANPSSVAGFTTGKTVGIEWTSPLDADGMPAEDIDHFWVECDKSSAFNTGSIKRDRFVRGERKGFRVGPKSGPWYLRVRSVDGAKQPAIGWSPTVGPLYPGVAPENTAIAIEGEDWYGGGSVEDIIYPFENNSVQNITLPAGGGGYLKITAGSIQVPRRAALQIISTCDIKNVNGGAVTVRHTVRETQTPHLGRHSKKKYDDQELSQITNLMKKVVNAGTFNLEWCLKSNGTGTASFERHRLKMVVRVTYLPTNAGVGQLTSATHQTLLRANEGDDGDFG